MKKRISLFTLLGMLLISTTVYGFTDVKEDAWYYKDVISLKNEGIIGGYSDGSFKPQNNITNAEALKLVMTVLRFPETSAGTSNHWAAGIIKAADEKGLIDKDNFKSNEPITRAELAKLLATGLVMTGDFNFDLTRQPEKIFKDENTIYTTILQENGIIGGVRKSDGRYYNPNANITRAEISSVIRRTRVLRGVPVLPEAQMIKYIKMLTSQDLSRSAKTIPEYEDIFLYMGQHNKVFYCVDHIGISLDTLISNSQTMGHQAFENVRTLYPEYLGYISRLEGNYVATSYSGISQSSASEFSLVSDDFSSNDLVRMRTEFNKEALSVLQNLKYTGKLTSDMTEYEKAKVIFEWVVFNTEYDTELGPEGYSGYGQIVNGKANYQGYTATTNYLLRLLGIEAHGISGTAGSENHMWTIAVLDGKRYHIDSTWGDPIVNGSSANNSNIDYSYFAASGEEISKTHKWDKSKFGN